MNPDAQTLFAYAKTQEGATLRTLRRGAAFQVAVVGNMLEFSPASSRQPRRESKAAVDAVLCHFDKTQSWQMSDYQDVSFNASYVLTLLRGWRDNCVTPA
jgi:hypothetical protein